jgi:hypothetical protein
MRTSANQQSINHTQRFAIEARHLLSMNQSLAEQVQRLAGTSSQAELAKVLRISQALGIDPPAAAQMYAQTHGVPQLIEGQPTSRGSAAASTNGLLSAILTAETPQQFFTAVERAQVQTEAQDAPLRLSAYEMSLFFAKAQQIRAALGSETAGGMPLLLRIDGPSFRDSQFGPQHVPVPPSSTTPAQFFSRLGDAAHEGMTLTLVAFDQRLPELERSRDLLTVALVRQPVPDDGSNYEEVQANGNVQNLIDAAVTRSPRAGGPSPSSPIEPFSQRYQADRLYSWGRTHEPMAGAVQRLADQIWNQYRGTVGQIMGERLVVELQLVRSYRTERVFMEIAPTLDPNRFDGVGFKTYFRDEQGRRIQLVSQSSDRPVSQGTSLVDDFEFARVYPGGFLALPDHGVNISFQILQRLEQ